MTKINSEMPKTPTIYKIIMKGVQRQDDGMNTEMA